MKRYWKISCGSRGRLAELHRAARGITIDFNVAQDLAPFSSVSQLQEHLKQGQHRVIGVDAVSQCFTFAHVIGAGDIVFGYGTKTILLIGEVAGGYRFIDNKQFENINDHQPDASSRTHFLPVTWLSSRSLSTMQLSSDLRTKLSQLRTIIELENNEAEEILDVALKLGVLSEEVIKGKISCRI